MRKRFAQSHQLGVICARKSPGVFMATHSLRQSMSRKGRRYNKAVSESILPPRAFLPSLDYELLHKAASRCIQKKGDNDIFTGSLSLGMRYLNSMGYLPPIDTYQIYDWVVA